MTISSVILTSFTQKFLRTFSTINISVYTSRNDAFNTLKKRTFSRTTTTHDRSNTLRLIIKSSSFNKKVREFYASIRKFYHTCSDVKRFYIFFASIFKAFFTEFSRKVMFLFKTNPII